MADAAGRYAVVNPQTNQVENVIIAYPDFKLDGFTLVASDTANIGDTYAHGSFTPPKS